MIPAILLKGVEPVAAGKPLGGGRAGAPRLLPQLAPGQILSARVDSRLPDGSYKVVVAGQPLRMSLPAYAEPGDTLELAFVAREPRLSFVLRQRAPAATAQAPLLSAAGRLVAATMPQAGAPAPPVTVAAAAPLLAAPAADGARLAQTLAQSLQGSGLFYESHQAEWIAGRRALAQLRLEPQAGLSRGTGAPEPAATGPAALPGRAAAAAQGGATALPAGPNPVAPNPASGAAAGEAALAAEAPAPRAEPAIHPRSTPLVQQQLAALDTARVALQLEIWPGQWMQWEVEERQPGEGREPDALPGWNTQLRLELPQLGELRAALTLGADGLRIRLEAAGAASAALLQAHGADLRAALAAAGVPSAAIAIARHEPA